MRLTAFVFTLLGGTPLGPAAFVFVLAPSWQLQQSQPAELRPSQGL
jgi:hypothetical protein